MEKIHKCAKASIIVSLIFILINCNSKKEVKLNGYWAFLTDDKTYCEYYINDKIIAAVCSNDLNPIEMNYKFSSDSVFINSGIGDTYEFWFFIKKWGKNEVEIQFKNNQDVLLKKLILDYDPIEINTDSIHHENEKLFIQRANKSLPK